MKNGNNNNRLVTEDKLFVEGLKWEFERSILLA